jgi:hypothetical protein
MRVQNVGTQVRGAFRRGKRIITASPLEIVEIPKTQEKAFLASLTDAWAPVDPPAWPPGVKIRKTVPGAQRPGAQSVEGVKSAANATRLL